MVPIKLADGRVLSAYCVSDPVLSIWVTIPSTTAFTRASLVAQSVRNLPAMQKTWVRFLGWEDPMEKEMATHSRILTWRIPWKEEPGSRKSWTRLSKTKPTLPVHSQHEGFPAASCSPLLTQHSSFLPSWYLVEL